MWAKRRHEITSFRGLALSGPRSRVPENATSGAAQPWNLEQATEYETWASRTAGLWAPHGKPTNDLLATRALDRPSAVSYCRALSFLERSGGKTRFVAVFRKNGGGAGVYTRPIVGPWSGDVRPYLGLDETIEDGAYDATIYGNRVYLSARGTTRMLVTDGATRSVYQSGGDVDVTVFDAMIPAPVGAPVVTPTTWSVLGGFNGSYQHAVTYFRTWDGAESVPSPIATTDVSQAVPTIGWGSFTVALPSAPSPLYGVDQVRIYRTTAGGATMRLVGVVAIGTSSYRDGTSDTALSTFECPTLFGIEDLRAASLCAHDGRLYALNVYEDGAIFTNRIRWSEVGYPSVWQPLEYTDDAEGTGVAIRPVGRNLIALMTKRAYFVENRGGGVHRVEDTRDWPGCVGVAALCRMDEGVAWLSESGLCFADEYGRMQRIAAPELDGFFAHLNRSELADSALAYSTRHGVLTASLPGPVDEGGRRLIHVHVATGDAWIQPTAQRFNRFVSYADVSRAAKLGAVSADGTLHVMNSKPAQDVADVTVGPLRFASTREKRFRVAELAVRVRDSVTATLSARIGSQQRTKSETLEVSGGAALGVFLLGESTLARPERKILRLELAARDAEVYLTATVTPSGLPFEVESLTVIDNVPRSK